eukprot:s473_g6.t1
MSEILQDTFWNEFDMCRLGDLKDPQTGDAISKRLTVISTSEDLHVALHGKLCSGQHHHRPIAGNIRVNNTSMKMSQWTELYPQKFARQVGKILIHDGPLHVSVLAEESDEHPTKGRRLGTKLSPAAIAARFESNASDITWQTVMRLADQTAPRVGTFVVDQGELMQLVQHMCLRKKSTPARVSLTIFAAARSLLSSDSRVPVSQPDVGVSNPGAQRRPRENLDSCEQEDDRVKRFRTHVDNGPQDSQSHADSKPDTPEDSTSDAKPETEEHPKHVIDLASFKHGPLFQALKTEEQNWLLKLHRNLGHPGTAKLTEFCRQLQVPEMLLKAIPDLRCSTCQEMRGPVVSRPSAIHQPCDFGDVASMDGVTWTNQNGDQFHFYHFIDQSTLFHTAVASPGHSTEDACKALLSGWFNWAGPPGLLCVDSGTELNSDEFSNFLQRHSVKCRTCAAEAHWQNARTERHGGILQLMLNKMDNEQPIQNYEQLSIALSHATSTENQWSKHRGYPPEMLVFGRGVRVPGSITSDPTIAAHATALSNLPDGIRFRQDLATREAARKAFAVIDNDQTLRRALVHRSRPHRGFYDRGDWVMMWKKKGEADGNWIGPMQVVIQEGQNVVWVTRHHKLYRVPPEYVRSLSAFEEFKHQPSDNQTAANNQSIRPTHGGVQFHDMVSQQTNDSVSTGDQTQAPDLPSHDSIPRDALPMPEAGNGSSESSNAPVPVSSN